MEIRKTIERTKSIIDVEDVETFASQNEGMLSLSHWAISKYFHEGARQVKEKSCLYEGV